MAAIDCLGSDELRHSQYLGFLASEQSALNEPIGTSDRKPARAAAPAAQSSSPSKPKLLISRYCRSLAGRKAFDRSRSRGSFGDPGAIAQHQIHTRGANAFYQCVQDRIRVVRQHDGRLGRPGNSARHEPRLVARRDLPSSNLPVLSLHGFWPRVSDELRSPRRLFDLTTCRRQSRAPSEEGGSS